MTPVIEAWAAFHNATPTDLFALFMDSDKHSAATGMPAKISRKVGGKWSAFGGMILGRTLALVPNRMIVQAWRSSGWKKADPDSILVAHFEKSASGGATVYLTHVGVPEYDHKGVTQGRIKYYWDPWRKYLKGRKREA
jgi:activator of HSP90 ATPase